MYKLLFVICFLTTPSALACELHGNNPIFSFFPRGQKHEARNFSSQQKQNNPQRKLLDEPQTRINQQNTRFHLKDKNKF